jgi:hypothetical protein
MSGGMSHISGWEYQRKTYQGGEGYQKPNNSNHVREFRPPELFASELDGPAEATHNPVALPATTQTHDYESVWDSMNEPLTRPESPSKDSLRFQIDSRVGSPLSNIENPQPTLSSSMSGFLPIENQDPARSSSSNHNILPLYFGESEGIHSLLNSRGLNGSDFPSPEENSPPEGRIDTTNAAPPNGRSPEKNNLSIINPSSSLKSLKKHSPKSIPTKPPTGHKTEPSSIILDTYSTEPITGAVHYPESTLEKQPLGGFPEHLQTSSDSQDQQPALAALSSHQQSIFNPTERQEPVLVTQDHSELSPDKPDNPEHITQQWDDREPIRYSEHQKSILVAPNPPGLISDEQSHQEFMPEERGQCGLVLEEKRHISSTTKGPDSPGKFSGFPNYPTAISDTQSRSESIKSHGFNKSRDQQPPYHREARLHRLRWRSLKTRALISEKRTGLRRLRNKMSDADADFVKLCRQRWLNGSQDELALKAGFEKLQATRNGYGPLEEEYNMLEERLDREEFELAELEEKMLKNSTPVSASQDTDLELQSSSSDESDSETSEAMKEQQNPLYKEFMSRLGDAGIHREAYSYLLFEHENLLEAEEVSQRYGREFPIKDQIALAKFDAREAKMLEEQREIDTDLERLRQECIRTGLLPGETSEEIDILQTSDGSVDPEPAEYYTFSQLLDQPGEIEDEKRSKELLTQFKSGDTGDRITRWLLHKLRSSCSEVELLARFTDGLDRTVDTRKWQEEVLYFWFLDSAILPPSAYELDPTVTAVPSPTLTDLSKVQHKLFGEKHFIELVVRSSSLSSALEFGMLLKIARMKGRSAVTR